MNPHQEAITCPYCSRAASKATGRDIYPSRGDLWVKKFWVCYPCMAWVGCHGKGYEPLGSPAKADLRQARSRVHALFDPIWKNRRDRRSARTEAYRKLSEALNIPFDKCHIGMMDLETCDRAETLLRS